MLHTLGYDITTVKDEEFFTPVERAAANYSYDAAAYLSETMEYLSDGYLNYIAKKTDSKGILRLMRRVGKVNAFGPITKRPLLLLFLQLTVIYLCVWQPGLLLRDGVIPDGLVSQALMTPAGVLLPGGLFSELSFY